jgi:hypothetical protein
MNCSSLSNARMAEASRTILFIHRCPASFSNQVIGESSRFDERSQALPGLCKPRFNCRDANLVVLNSQVYFVADLETKSRAESCWYNNAAVSLDPGTTFELCVGHFPASHQNNKATSRRMLRPGSGTQLLTSAVRWWHRSEKEDLTAKTGPRSSLPSRPRYSACGKDLSW